MTDLGSDRFVTFEKSHPEFKSYLLGTFSESQIALPVSSLFVNTPKEQVTFQILDSQRIGRPRWWPLLYQVLRFDLLTLTLSPALVVLALERKQIQHTDLVGWALLALFLLHGAVFCRNDYMDHLRGVDRWNERGGSRVIQRGWLRAHQVRQIYYILLAAAVGCALPVFWAQPILLAVAGVTALLGIWGYSHLRSGRGPWWLSTVSVFLCLGPLLTGAFSWLLTETVSLNALIVGANFGWIAVVYTLARHTISMVVDDQAGLRTLPVRLGFDRMKILMFAMTILLMLLGGFAFSWIEPGVKGLTVLPLLAWLVFFGRKIYALSSPFASALFEVPRDLIRFHMATSVLLLVYLFL